MRKICEALGETSEHERCKHKLPPPWPPLPLPKSKCSIDKKRYSMQKLLTSKIDFVRNSIRNCRCRAPISLATTSHLILLPLFCRIFSTLHFFGDPENENTHAKTRNRNEQNYKRILNIYHIDFSRHTSYIRI